MTNKIENNIISEVVKAEGIDESVLESRLKEGKIVIIKGNRHNVKPMAVGEGCRTKVNVNIGTSPEICDIEYELDKLKAAIEYGADAVMDLSTGGDLRAIRKEIIRRSTVVVGSVPIYQVATELNNSGKSITDMTVDHLFRVIEEHLEDGIDFITVHCGVTQEGIAFMKKNPRVVGIVSRGGSLLYKWMTYHNKENPLYEQYDRLLELAKAYDATLSLGDGLRPGGLPDATDRMQIHELLILGELIDRARQAGVKAIVEGPGHIPMNEIAANIMLQKKICKAAPFYVLGPIVTDIAPGYDHITGAIGGAIAGWAGADFLCYLTPAEHLGLPDIHEVIEGLIATKIAAHAADIAKGNPSAIAKDKEFSQARKNFDWNYMLSHGIAPKKAFEIWKRKNEDITRKMCSMCGIFCSMREFEE
jgi:phosphomethylpyrimidine synthase